MAFTQKTDANYEFVRGRIIRKSSMKQEVLFIVDFLIRQFVRTRAFEQGDNLLTEFDFYVDAYRKRVPDLAYFSVTQIADTRLGKRVMPAGVIDSISGLFLPENCLHDGKSQKAEANGLPRNANCQ
ncbi:hypothetical protein [Spirosoma pulveris]